MNGLPTSKVRRQRYIDFYLAGGNPLFLKDGRRHGGGSSRCAFWAGFDGAPNNLYPGMVRDCYNAGVYCAKHHRDRYANINPYYLDRVLNVRP